MSVELASTPSLQCYVPANWCSFPHKSLQGSTQCIKASCSHHTNAWTLPLASNPTQSDCPSIDATKMSSTDYTSSSLGGSCCSTTSDSGSSTNSGNSSGSSQGFVNVSPGSGNTTVGGSTTSGGSAGGSSAGGGSSSDSSAK